MTFRELNVGDTFDFISDDRPNSFYSRCTKSSPHCYTWDGITGNLKSRVGTINVHVFHVTKVRGESNV